MSSMTILLAVAFAFGDDLFLVHEPNDGPFFATRTGIVDGATTQVLGPVAGSFLKCFSSSGKQPLRMVFAADRDGDGVDEVAFLRE